MPIGVPSLSVRGWKDEPGEILSSLFAYYLSTDYLQSVAWQGKLASFQYQLEKHQQNPGALRDAISTTFESLLTTQFPEPGSVTVEVSIESVSEETPSQLEIKIEVKVHYNGMMYELAKSLETENSTVKRIVDLNNG